MTKKKHRCTFGPFEEPPLGERPMKSKEDFGGNWLTRTCIECGLIEWRFDETGLILVNQELSKYD